MTAIAELPTITPALTYLDADNPRTNAVHRLALASVTGDTDRRVYWIDARNTASTYAFPNGHERPRVLDAIRIARAFTAYQHHSLVHEVARRVDDDTALIVAPCVGSLYGDDDVPTAEAAALFDDTMTVLAELVDDRCIPVLLTAATAPFVDRVRERADRSIAATTTAMGTRFDADDFETTLYYGPGFWQTTIPYWTDLLGIVDETAMVDIAVDHPTLVALT